MAKNNTTIAISFEANARLQLLCDSLGYESKKDFIEDALDYFQRTGVDPRTNEKETIADILTKSAEHQATQYNTIAAELSNNRNDTALTKKQNETLFTLLNNLQAQQTAMQEAMTKQIEAQTAKNQASSDELKALTETVISQTKKKRHWWSRNEE